MYMILHTIIERYFEYTYNIPTIVFEKSLNLTIMRRVIISRDLNHESTVYYSKSENAKITCRCAIYNSFFKENIML